MSQLSGVETAFSDGLLPGGERQDLGEEVGKRCLVADAKARDRRVIGSLLSGDHAVGDVLVESVEVV